MFHPNTGDMFPEMVEFESVHKTHSTHLGGF
jgi:molybdopterin biosynthesis enzyme MoaB